LKIKFKTEGGIGMLGQLAQVRSDAAAVVKQVTCASLSGGIENHPQASGLSIPPDVGWLAEQGALVMIVARKCFMHQSSL
jgi:hypothetical protein